MFYKNKFYTFLFKYKSDQTFNIIDCMKKQVKPHDNNISKSIQ